MSASTLRAAADAIHRDGYDDDPLAAAAAHLFRIVARVGPAHGGAEWDATVTLARTYLGDQS